MKNGLCWWILLLYVIASQTAARGNTRIGVYVKNDRELPPPFLEFVRQKPIYVDKTRFIEYALRKWRGRFVILTAPPGWGKSTLFDMLQFFFEAELDARYRAVPLNLTVSYGFFAHGQLDGNVFIEPPLISHRVDLIGQYVARHPVIKLRFHYIEQQDIPSYAHFLSCFKYDMLKQIRDRHRAAMKTLCSDGRNLIGQRVPATQLCDLCNNFEKDTLNETELRYYASKWATWLGIYYAKSPVILVDGYDEIFADLYLPRVFWGIFARQIDDALRTRIIDFFIDFLDITYRHSNSLFTLLTGVLPIDIGQRNYTYSRYSVVNHQHEDVYQYLGFTKQQADKILRHRGFQVEDMPMAKPGYGGYLVEWKPNVTVFSPLFVLERDRSRLPMYDTRLGKLRLILMNTTWYNRSVKKYVAQLLLDKRIPSCNPNHRRLLSFDQLRSINDPVDEFGALLRSTDLLWLLGYLTYDHDQDRFNIPNQECRKTLHEALFRPHFIPDLSVASTALIELLQNSNQEPDIFVNQYVRSLFWAHCDLKSIEKIDFCLVALYDILRHASAVHGYQCTAEMNVTDGTAQQQPISGPYLTIHNGTYGAVIEVKYDAEVANLSAVFRRDLSSRVNSFHRAYPHVKTLRMMMINLSPQSEGGEHPIANYLDQVYYNPDLH